MSLAHLASRGTNLLMSKGVPNLQAVVLRTEGYWLRVAVVLEATACHRWLQEPMGN